MTAAEAVIVVPRQDCLPLLPGVGAKTRFSAPFPSLVSFSSKGHLPDRSRSVGTRTRMTAPFVAAQVVLTDVPSVGSLPLFGTETRFTAPFFSFSSRLSSERARITRINNIY